MSEISSNLSKCQGRDSRSIACIITIYLHAGLAPALERVLPQASIVCATAVSESGRYLAVGLESGVIVTWDLRTS